MTVIYQGVDTQNVQNAINAVEAEISTAVNLAAHEADVSTHGVSSVIVGETEVQTLTNKTINATNNTISNIAAANMDIFVSTVLTGTGAPQNVAHGLGAIPSVVIIVPVVTAGPVNIVYGVNTSTNVVTTVTAGDTFKVLAIK